MSERVEDEPGTLYVGPELYETALRNSQGTPHRVALDPAMIGSAWRYEGKRTVCVRVQESDALSDTR